MKRHSRSNRARMSVVAGSILTAGTLAVTPAAAAPAQQEASDVTVILRITVNPDPSWAEDAVMISVPGSHGNWDCHTGFAPHVPKDVEVSVPANTNVTIWSSHGCYDAIQMSGAWIPQDKDGQVINVRVGGQ
ncbi:hypothetical protein [Streptomyces muensis]|uniref:Uncharacterized protein n=1 Tax=Streptomyces muensis TaxID=1077944 RepID=A0A9X1PSN3_STRM4|nr:hypothetical protein [Streptomyces muensis]MCF1592276.1 hypothetical protein [Streptomyces muensis]